jgi:hypothetical protein
MADKECIETGRGEMLTEFLLARAEVHWPECNRRNQAAGGAQFNSYEVYLHATRDGATSIRLRDTDQRESGNRNKRRTCRRG